jgi:hypothetical protein
MRCAACGTEMLLVKVAPDNTMISSGYERYTLQCLGCFKLDEHLIFNSAKSSQTPSHALDGFLGLSQLDNEHHRMAPPNVSGPDS